MSCVYFCAETCGFSGPSPSKLLECFRRLTLRCISIKIILIRLSNLVHHKIWWTPWTTTLFSPSVHATACAYLHVGHALAPLPPAVSSVTVVSKLLWSFMRWWCLERELVAKKTELLHMSREDNPHFSARRGKGENLNRNNGKVGREGRQLKIKGNDVE